MGSKSSQTGGKGKRKNNGPAEQRYKTEMRWLANKAKAIVRNKRAVTKSIAKHARRNTLGVAARRAARSEKWRAAA